MSAFTDRLKKFFSSGKKLSDDIFDDLCDLLVEGDFGPAGAYKLSDALKELCRKEKAEDGEAARIILGRLLAELLVSNRPPDLIFPGRAADKLEILILLGVNGTGKTTTAAKLAKRCLDLGKRPILAAGDTFRAAAIDQIKIHGERLGVRVVAHQHGGDPAAVIYDAVEAAKSSGADVIIADTAGRMHTKTSLIGELQKIDRIVASKAENATYSKLLVLDATTGRNALNQAEIFHGAVNLDGFILTKYDSGAKGGAVFSLAEDLNLHAVFLCTGEKYSDIELFNPGQYANAFIGLE